jgi:hypothetical protein
MSKDFIHKARGVFNTRHKLSRVSLLTILKLYLVDICEKNLYLKLKKLTGKMFFGQMAILLLRARRVTVEQLKKYIEEQNRPIE